MQQSANHIMMMEPTDFHSNPETMETNTYQAEDPEDIHSVEDQAIREFRAFRDRLVEAGIMVTTVRGQAGCPDDIFCNNWVSTQVDKDGKASLVYYPMLAPNRRLERRPEIMKMLEGRYPIALDLSAEELTGKYLESTGSLWMDRVNRVVYIALSPRTNEELARRWAEKMDFAPVFFHTRNHAGKPVYHTDVMMFIGTGYAGICLECIEAADRARVVESLSKTHEIIELTLPQLRSFCGNALELRGTGDAKKLVMSGAAYRALSEDQKSRFLKYVSEIVWADIPAIEKYGGGSARCMLLELH
jgi:hypothetical protein